MVKIFNCSLAFLMLYASCKDYRCDLKRIRGKNRLEISECLRNVVSDRQFFLSARTHLYEYQNGLLELIGNLQSGDSVLVRETSMREGKNKVVLWFKKEKNDWIVIDKLEIPPNVAY